MTLRLLRGAPAAAKSLLLCHLRSSSSTKPGGRSEPAKQPLKKPKLPVGRFDEPEESSMEKEPLEKFPDGINPTTKERGGPRGPEPTRFGDWERKGRLPAVRKQHFSTFSELSFCSSQIITIRNTLEFSIRAVSKEVASSEAVLARICCFSKLKDKRPGFTVDSGKGSACWRLTMDAL
ncbi:Succinate dehydrogenase assembly factor 4, partial [Lamprotornis superbus]